VNATALSRVLLVVRLTGMRGMGQRDTMGLTEPQQCAVGSSFLGTAAGAAPLAVRRARPARAVQVEGATALHDDSARAGGRV